VRCGGNWKRDYGDFYTGTQRETPIQPRSGLRITAPVPDPTNRCVERLESTVVGLSSDWECPTTDPQRLSGEVFVTYTDGITEAFNERDEEFGENG
jgi:hypothetical protein